MKQDKILVIGALGQIGTELTTALQSLYGESAVVAADIVEPRNMSGFPGIYEHLNVLDIERLYALVEQYEINQIYLLAAILSAKGESNPQFAWRLNMEGLMNGLEAANKYHCKLFWPSSIAVFGPSTLRDHTPQHTVTDPTTIYGISKLAGERWCDYYFRTRGVDVRSLRYPGLISYKTLPGGGTTDYAVDIFYQALEKGAYTCFLSEHTYLPMMYMPDAIRATLELMHADSDKVRERGSYNLAGISFSPTELAASIRRHIPNFEIRYEQDFRQAIADSWPNSIDDSVARRDWEWKPQYDLETMTEDMLQNLKERLSLQA